MPGSTTACRLDCMPDSTLAYGLAVCLAACQSTSRTACQTGRLPAGLAFCLAARLLVGLTACQTARLPTGLAVCLAACLSTGARLHARQLVRRSLSTNLVYYVSKVVSLLLNSLKVS